MKRLSAVMLISLCGVILVWFVAQRNEREPSENAVELSEASYLRAVHWFGDAWPVNFWNTDLEAVAVDHLELAKADGFNTVVFVVPWPGFSPNPTSGDLDPERIQRLKVLMQIAEDMGFKIVVRLSYAWDWLDSGSGGRLLQLWLDDEYYKGWLGYIESLWDALEEVQALEFGFFSWEDLWAITSLGDADEPTRRAAAASSGFANWLVETHGLTSAGKLMGGPLSSVDDVVIPRRREPAWAVFMSFVSDAWVERFFLPAQKRFPPLSMEIRIDSDPIFDGDDLVEWFDHRPNWDLPGADWVTLYWAPAMGGVNQGEVLSAETGVQRLDWWLSEVAEHAGMRQIFIGQFLVEDFTPGYEMNGRIPTKDIPDFLKLAQSPLQQKTAGFGLWTWADYAHDAIANPDFFAALEGWETSEGLSAVDQMVRMEADDWIATTLGRFFYSLPDGTETASLCVVGKSERSVTLAVFEDQRATPSGRLSFDADAEEQCIEHSLASRHLRLLAEGPLEIHRVSSTGFVQSSGVRDLAFSLKPAGAAWQALNNKLQYRPRLSRPRYDDGWMGRVMLEWIEAEGEAVELEISTHLPDDWPQAPLLNVSIAGESVGQVPCQPSGRHRFPLPQSAMSLESVRVRVEASAVHRPDGDARQLGCHIADLSLRGPVNMQGVGQTPER